MNWGESPTRTQRVILLAVATLVLVLTPLVSCLLHYLIGAGSVSSRAAFLLPPAILVLTPILILLVAGILRFTTKLKTPAKFLLMLCMVSCILAFFFACRGNRPTDLCVGVWSTVSVQASRRFSLSPTCETSSPRLLQNGKATFSKPLRTDRRHGFATCSRTGICMWAYTIRRKNDFVRKLADHTFATDAMSA